MIFAQYGGGGGGGGFFFLIQLVIIVVMIVAGWKIFEKAGQPGWASIIPFYNFYVMLQIVGKEWWWLILMFIPFVNIAVAIYVGVLLAQSFGKSTGFGVGLALLGFIFGPILAFGDAQYGGPAGAGSATV